MSNVLPVILILTALVSVFGLTTAYILRSQYGASARLRRRAESVAGLQPKQSNAAAQKAGTGKRKAIQAKLKELDDKKKEKKKDGGIAEKIMQSGMNISVKEFYIYGALFGLACCVLYFLKGYNLIGLPFVAIAMGVGFPRWFIKFKAKRLQKKFTLQFGDALDVIVRGIKTGLPVGECLNMIGREMPDPVGFIFRFMIEGQKIGMTLDEVLEKAIVRMPTPELQFYAIVMNIQQQTGGNLADTLDNLSGVLRERRKIKDKIQALSSEAKASAGIIGSLPFIVTGLLYLVNRDYIMLLFTDPIGHILIMGGLTWMGIGILVMWKMINFDF